MPFPLFCPYPRHALTSSNATVSLVTSTTRGGGGRDPEPGAYPDMHGLVPSLIFGSTVAVPPQVPSAALDKEDPKWFCPVCVERPDAPPQALKQEPPPDRHWPAAGGADIDRLVKLLRAH